MRHIVGNQGWDSYAKAAWVAEALTETSMSIGEIKAMIGDTAGFIDRIVEGYNVVRQALNEGIYDPATSLRSGRGSFQSFPFSWVYTLLGYHNVREYLNLPKSPDPRDKEPIDQDRHDQLANILTFMFGNDGKPASVSDSRELGRLALCLREPASIAALQDGRDVAFAHDMSRPQPDRIARSLKTAIEAISTAADIVGGNAAFERDSLRSFLGSADEIQERTESFTLLVDSKMKKHRPRRSLREEEVTEEDSR